MQSRTLFVVLALAIAACSPSATEETTTSTSTTTTVPTTTTTTIDPAVIAAGTCDDMKVAAFDLDAAITAGLTDLGIESESELAEAEVGRIVVEALVDFYDDLALLSADAPEEISEALVVVSEGADPWREAIDRADPDLGRTLEELDPASLLTPEVETAAATLDEWTTETCGVLIPVDPEEVSFTTVFAAMLGALGSVFGDLGRDLFPEDPVTEVDDTALVYGDDPRLDGLYDRCGTADGQACRDLYVSAYGEYELWGQTCGASIPLREAFVVDCESKFAAEPTEYGSDFVLDSLWDDCEASNASACDGLFAAAPFDSVYEDFGATCGGTREGGDFTVPCSFLQSGEPFSYGDDPAFDLLWDACSLGDVNACDDLFFQSPLYSAYEAFGRICGDLSELGATCENAAQWLGADSL